MYLSSSLGLLLLDSLVSAEWRIPGAQNMIAMRDGTLRPRQDGVCFSDSTCSECFGKGYVVCDKVGCVNPSRHQHCCANGSICVAKDNSCCDNWGGPGEVGKDGTVQPRPPLDLPTGTQSGASSQPTSYTCTRKDSGEECCQRGGKDNHWCTGEFPRYQCYNIKLQICCDDGTVCEGKDCCDLVSAKEITPSLDDATKLPDEIGLTIGVATPRFTTASTSSSGSTSAAAATATTEADADASATPSSSNIAVPTKRSVFGDIAVIGAIGLALL
ncbi:hypothetical protein AJ80_03485 [Polytolypa hystricis UAMH7299]|uniref:Uncharacterized protein n=1 Tax=Polytolypa hystricis (strain UAMH7299) TaxID=1447883 RepID=A0A2B7YHG6_POLH7|nr:hypothetical protein AJ80_03485 [Polytolypa hystricis UAMH7299]